MKFGRTPVEKAAGHILAHSVAAGGRRHAKGALIDARLQASLRAAGLSSIWTAEIEAGDVPEDEAAGRLARHIAGAGLDLSAPSKGRVNLTAAEPGLLRIDRDAFRALATLDESLALASLPAMRRAEAGQLVATLKIIPYAVAGMLLERALAGKPGILSLAPFRARKTGLILTRAAGMPAKLLDKSRETLEARLRALDCGIVKATVRDHHEEAVAEAVSGSRAAGADLIIILGASATIDRADLVPRGIEQAGGVIDRFGLPVDPGNLLMTARLGETDIIVAPGCAPPREGPNAKARNPRRLQHCCWRQGPPGAWAMPTSCWRRWKTSPWSCAQRRDLRKRVSARSSQSPAMKPTGCARRWPQQMCNLSITRTMKRGWRLPSGRG